MTKLEQSAKMKAWLPKNALEQCSPEPVLVRALEHWRAHWLATAEVSIAPIYQDNCPLLPSSMKWRSTPDVSLAWREGAQWTLAGAMLGQALAPASLLPTDRQLLGAIAENAIDDLVRRFGALAGEDTDVETRGSAPVDLNACSWWEISLGAGKPIFKLALAPERLVQLMKQDLGASERPVLGSIRRGLGGQTVSLAAELGRCRLSLADLRELGVGDVLVLETKADQPVQLAVDGRSTPFRANLEAGDDGAAKLILVS